MPYRNKRCDSPTTVTVVKATELFSTLFAETLPSFPFVTHYNSAGNGILASEFIFHCNKRYNLTINGNIECLRVSAKLITCIASVDAIDKYSALYSSHSFIQNSR